MRALARVAALLGPLLALVALAVGCAARQLPDGCSEVAFGELAAGCVAKVRLAAPADRSAVADACNSEITAREDACYEQIGGAK